MNEITNEKGVCRTAPAISGLLKITPEIETNIQQKFIVEALPAGGRRRTYLLVQVKVDFNTFYNALNYYLGL